MADTSLSHAHACTQSQSKPEKFGQWLFKTTSNWRTVLAFALVAALTYISIRFNIELGRLSAADEVSKELLPSGYALLDLCALFLSGYVGLKTKSPIRKAIAWVWFAFLLCLSLWAAAAFTMSVDYRQSLAPLDAQIERKRTELKTQQASVKTWQDNVAKAVVYKTKHQGTLSREQIKETMLAGELAHLEAQRVPPAQIIYERISPYVGIDAPTIQLIIRLLWAAALTLSPLILVLLIAAEFVLVGDPKDAVPDTTSPTPPSGGKKSSTDLFHKENNTNSTPERVHPSLSPITASAPERIQYKTATNTATAPETRGVQHDTGVDGKAGNRYQDLKRNVISGKVKPSLRHVRNYCRCRQDVAQRYIKAMAEEGIIEPAGQGWKVKKLRAV